MKVTFHEKVKPSDLPKDAIANTYISFMSISDVNACAKELLLEISDTSWINALSPVAKMSYESTAKETIHKLVEIFKSVDNQVTKDFGEFMISMGSGHYLKDKHNHVVLPLSELWKEKISNNHGFDFHTLSPSLKFSFGEAKYVSTGNSYTTAAEQVHRFSKEGKDKRDAVHLLHFADPIAITNLNQDRKGYILAFSINSNDYEKILKNALNNVDVKSLTKRCDELYIIGVKA
ncbi:hypothetical protein PCNPT3_08295 [Psychromonas sp. CNPT3]|uniref:hypothetical protein n=1 Tax=Psychromonas sp. CNPT3 TaxID=314282 RepID=UPI00006EA489|nr:hypothetical protein [Psychromonas sp. CNPT3]AGH81597.1 hypothetical protein PCNPT3_08295 [Psychromonas sp. CNPT3]